MKLVKSICYVFYDNKDFIKQGNPYQILYFNIEVHSPLRTHYYIIKLTINNVSVGNTQAVEAAKDQ